MIMNHSHTQETFISNRESDGQNDMDEVVYFHLQYIIYNHIPKILRGCNCVGMLYTCMAWICNSISHDTGKQGLFIFRWHPGRTSCNEEVTCSILPEAFVTASWVPYDDDVTMRPWSLPSVFMFRRRLLRVLVWRPMSCEVKIIS